MRSKLLARIAAGAAAITVAMPASSAMAAVLHEGVVDRSAVANTPSLVPTTYANGHPHVDAIDQLGSTMYAGGLFDKVSKADGSQQVVRNNFFAFNASTGAVNENITPNVNGQVWAVEAVGDSVYVGGTFSSVNGVARKALVKLNATTGAVDPAFDAGFGTGMVTDLEMVGTRLFVAGSVGSKLMALNPTTGARTSYINLGIKDPLLGSRGGAAVFKFAVDPAKSKLVAVGNFRTVGATQGNRLRAFMADLGLTSAKLNPWYYQPLANTNNCSSDQVGDARRIPHLQGVDFSPAGDYFVVAATGRNPATNADWETKGDGKGGMICDAVARFETNVPSPIEPTWVNYTGGDSVWAVAATGAAVYAQGHFKYLDNKYGYRSGGVDKPAPTAVVRYGVGAIDSVTGTALGWNPVKPAKQGGKEFLATQATPTTQGGLWIVSDSQEFNGKPRYGIAFTPLPGS